MRDDFYKEIYAILSDRSIKGQRFTKTRIVRASNLLADLVAARVKDYELRANGAEKFAAETLKRATPADDLVREIEELKRQIAANSKLLEMQERQIDRYKLCDKITAIKPSGRFVQAYHGWH